MVKVLPEIDGYWRIQVDTIATCCLHCAVAFGKSKAALFLAIITSIIRSCDTLSYQLQLNIYLYLLSKS